ncbi:hypothetical protein DL767_007879 [Monosporascus sp. MG133]|nr:hypothetical protein DL767_007879 [Monosporascus sp. MG133]
MSDNTQEPTIQQYKDTIKELEEAVQRLKAQVNATRTNEVKIKPKKPEPYDGKGSVQSFLTQARVYLRFERVIDKADKILAVAAFLKGNALD